MYVILDKDKNVISYGTVIASPEELEEKEYVAVEIDDNIDGKVWDSNSESMIDLVPHPDEQKFLDDERFLAGVDEKLSSGKELSLIEQQRLTLISIRRGK